MVFHVVLFRVRHEMDGEARRAFVLAWQRALDEIPVIRRVRIGHRVTHGREYERGMLEDMEYAAVLEFDDMAGLQAYLRHPAHDELGARFHASAASAYVYDYEELALSNLEQMLESGASSGGD